LGYRAAIIINEKILVCAVHFTRSCLFCNNNNEALTHVGLSIHSWLQWQLPQVSCMSYFLLNVWQTSCLYAAAFHLH